MKQLHYIYIYPIQGYHTTLVSKDSQETPISVSNDRFGQIHCHPIFDSHTCKNPPPPQPITQTLRDLMGEQEIKTLETEGKLTGAEQRQRKLEEDMRREMEQRKRKRREQLQREQEYEKVLYTQQREYSVQLQIAVVVCIW